MKKLLCLALTLAAVLALSACTDKNYTEAERQALIDRGTPLIL